MRALSLLTISVFALSHNAMANQPNDSFQKYLEQTLAVSMVLTDSEVFAFGIHDFDPNDWFNLDNEDIGSEDSIELRKQIAVSTLPFTIELSDKAATHKHLLFTRLSAVASRRDIDIRPQDPPDKNEDIVLGGFLAYRYQYQINETWSITPGLGGHLQYYRNDHKYQSDYARQLQPYLDGVVLNTSAYAVSIEPHATLMYKQLTNWGSWNATSSGHYFVGRGWGDANYGEVGTPEGWYIANGVEAFYEFKEWGRAVQSIYSSVKRIDLGGDTRRPFGTTHYYEASVGWLMTPPFEVPWVENVGIGLSFNYGSALKGGSIVLFFNQE